MCVLHLHLLEGFRMTHHLRPMLWIEWEDTASVVCLFARPGAAGYICAFGLSVQALTSGDERGKGVRDTHLRSVKVEATGSCNVQVSQQF